MFYPTIALQLAAQDLHLLDPREGEEPSSRPRSWLARRSRALLLRSGRLVLTQACRLRRAAVSHTVPSEGLPGSRLVA